MQLLPTRVFSRKKHCDRSRLHVRESIVLAADLSPSMMDEFRIGNGRSTTRLQALQQAAAFFFTQKAAADSHAHVAVIGFSREARLLLDWASLTHIQRVLRAIRSLRAAGPYTNISAAMKMALDRHSSSNVQSRSRPRAKVLLVTDGAANVDTGQHGSLIQRACSQGVRLYTVAICNRRDNPNTYDRDLLLQMARETKGYFHTAHTLKQLEHALMKSR